MKNLKLTIVTFGLIGSSFGQSSTSCNALFDDFSSPTLWTHPVLGTNLQSPTNYSTINVSAGKMNFMQSNDNDMNYIYRSGITISNTDFRAELEFKHTSNSATAGGAGHVVLALCSDLEPFFHSTTSVGGTPLSPSPLSLTPSIHDGIAVTFESDSEVSPSQFFFQLYLIDDGVMTSVGMPAIVGGPLPAGSEVNYYLQFIRIGTTSGLLNVYADPARTMLINTSGLITIPSSIINLNTVQFGTNEWQEAERMLVGSIDNLCIDNFAGTFVSGGCNTVYDDFDSPFLWAHPLWSSTLSCNAIPTMHINAGKFQFAQSTDNNVNYLNRSGFLINDVDFKAEIDFTYVSNGALPSSELGGAGHTLLALNAGALPFFSNPNLSPGLPGIPCFNAPLSLTNNFQEGIAVTFESDLPVDATDFQFKVYVNDGTGTFPVMVSTPISVGPAPIAGVATNYYLRLQRSASTVGTFSVFSDPGRTILVGTPSNFALPSSLGGFNTVQIGGNEWQDYRRLLTGSLDNLCIQNTSQTMSLEADLERKDVKIYPNPTNGNLNIQLNENSYFHVVDVFGKSVFSGHLEKGVNTIETNALQSGVYLLYVAVNGRTEPIKFIKQ